MDEKILKTKGYHCPEWVTIKSNVSMLQPHHPSVPLYPLSPSHITQVSHYRAALRESGVLERLVDFLSSSNDTIVSMSCGALWNLSARSLPDQELLRECGAVSTLRSLSLHPDKNVSSTMCVVLISW